LNLTLLLIYDVSVVLCTLHLPVSFLHQHTVKPVAMTASSLQLITTAEVWFALFGPRISTTGSGCTHSVNTHHTSWISIIIVGENGDMLVG